MIVFLNIFKFYSELSTGLQNLGTPGTHCTMVVRASNTAQYVIGLTVNFLFEILISAHVECDNI